MFPWRLIFLILAFLLFVLAAFDVTQRSVSRVSLGWLGMAFLTLALWLH